MIGTKAEEEGGILRIVLGDQLSPEIAALRDAVPGRDTILLAEVLEEATYVRHHAKKVAFIFSAMRHFAAELRESGLAVDYVTLDDPANTGTLAGEVARAVARHHARRVVATFPGEWRVAEAMRGWQRQCGVPVEIREDGRFFCSRGDFARYVEGRRGLRMEFFYREMRRRTGLLMEPDGEPSGGQWNFDPENRKRLPPRVTPPPPFRVAPDAITREVLDLVARHLPDHFGSLDGFCFGVTRREAEAALRHFLDYALPDFGDYQDAMRQGEDLLFHSLLSPYLNAGLLDPRVVCAAVEAAWRAGKAPLNAAEGYIRQILGWREYMRGVYWTYMPEYAERNAFEAHRPIPAFYWTGEAPMNCLRQCIDQTRRTAYAHHIQRLMVTGNFALIAGIEPKQVAEWYLAVYADAYEWVELPNVHGMALYADGGLLGSKPYAAGGAYINRMSDYCRGCQFDPKETLGKTGCPFNALYWDFLMRNEKRLGGNNRLAMPYRTLERMGEEKRAAIRARATEVLDGLEPWVRPRS